MGDLSVSSASNFQAAKIGSEISYAVAAKVLDSQRQQGAGVIDLLQSASGRASSGSSVAGDPLMAAATGLGGSLDVSA